MSFANCDADELRRRFLKKVRKTARCWFWTGAVSTKKSGFQYGNFKFGPRYMGTHRAAYLLFIGPIPNGLCVLHRCDNTICVNPDHFFLGTKTDNNTDKVAKNRHPKGESHGAAKLHTSDVRRIREACSRGIPHRLLAIEFNVCRQTIGDIFNRRRWAHI
jgi:hypothetical protein